MTAPTDGRADVLWFLPTHGDGRYLGAQEGAREVSLSYLRQIAQGADEVLLKPVAMGKLLKAMSQMLAKAAGSNAVVLS